jgi:hypothetical protein
MFLPSSVETRPSHPTNSTALVYFILMSYIVLRVLNETRPMYWYALAALLFVLSQLAWFLLGKVVCKVCRLIVSK